MNDENLYFKKLSWCTTREGQVEDTPFRYNYTYKFSAPQFLEQIDDLSSMSSNEIKQIYIDQLTHEFKSALNSFVFGDAAGKDYVESLEHKKSEEIFILMKLGNMTITEINTLTSKERFLLADAFQRHAKEEWEAQKKAEKKYNK